MSISGSKRIAGRPLNVKITELQRVQIGATQFPDFGKVETLRKMNMVVECASPKSSHFEYVIVQRTMWFEATKDYDDTSGELH